MMPGGLPGVGIGGVGGSFPGGVFGGSPVSSPVNANQEEGEDDDENVRGLQRLRLEAVT